MRNSECGILEVRRQMAEGGRLSRREPSKADKYRIMNVEGMYSVFFIKKTVRSDSILRNSAVGYSAVLRFVVLLTNNL